MRGDTKNDASGAKDPLHGITLRYMLEKLLVRGGWEGLASTIRAKCFSENPSVESSLKFLRRTPWARVKVERLYIRAFLGGTGKWYKTPTTLPPRPDENDAPGSPDQIGRED